MYYNYLNYLLFNNKMLYIFTRTVCVAHIHTHTHTHIYIYIYIVKYIYLHPTTYKLIFILIYQYLFIWISTCKRLHISIQFHLTSYLYYLVQLDNILLKILYIISLILLFMITFYRSKYFLLLSYTVHCIKIVFKK